MLIRGSIPKRLLSVLVLTLSVSALAGAQSTIVTEEAFVDLLTGKQELSPLYEALFDVNEDGLVGTADLMYFLRLQMNADPKVGFGGNTFTIGEGDDPATEDNNEKVVTIPIRFTKAFSGELKFSIDTTPISGSYEEGQEPPRQASAILNEDYTISGPGLTLHAPDADGVVRGTLFVDPPATETALTVTAIDDAVIEDMERVILWLEPSGDDAPYEREAPYHHTVFISDNDGRWVGVYAAGAESDLTHASVSMGFQLEFVQCNGAFSNGLVFLDADAAEGEEDPGTAVDFTGSSASRLSALFTLVTDGESSRFSSGLTRTLTLEADSSDDAQIFRPPRMFVGKYAEEIVCEALGGLQVKKEGIFMLMRTPSVPDVLQEDSDNE